MTRISLIEDSEIHMEWLKLELESDETLLVVSADATGRQGLESVRAEKPDIVLLDFQLRDLTGLEIARRIRAYEPQIKIFMLTAHTEISILERIIHDKHVDALALKGSYYFEAGLLSAIHYVVEGRAYLDPSLLEKLRESQDFPGLKQLSAREFEVFIQMHTGKDDLSISKDLCVERSYVRNLKSRIAKKTKNDNLKRLLLDLLENANLPK